MGFAHIHRHRITFPLIVLKKRPSQSMGKNGHFPHVCQSCHINKYYAALVIYHSIGQMHSATLLVSSLALLALFVSYVSTDERLVHVTEICGLSLSSSSFSLPFEEDFPELSTDDDHPKVRAIRAARRGGGGGSGGRRPQSPSSRPTLRLGPGGRHRTHRRRKEK